MGLLERIPIGAGTFKKSFLGGDGELKLASDNWRTIAGDAPFPNGADDVVELSISGGTGKDLSFGRSSGMTLGIAADGSAVGSIRLIRDAKDDLLAAHGVTGFTSGQDLYLALTLDGRGGGKAAASFPIGSLPLTAKVGLDAGGAVGYTRLKRYAVEASARAIVADLVAALTLPQNIDAVDEIPQPGEIVIFRYGGYLNVGAAVTWGYRFSGSKSLEVNDLQAALDYDVRLAASTSLGYSLAGNFTIEARRAQDEDRDWVRFVVRKSRTSRFDFAADFKIDADFDLNGLPQSSDDFLGALLGLDLRAASGYLEQVSRLTNLDAVREKLDGLATDYVQALADRWVGKALHDGNFADFLERTRGVIAAYRAVDQRLVDLYEHYLNRLPRLNEMLDKVAKLPSIEGLNQIGGEAGAEALQLVKTLAGDRLHELLTEPAAFQELQRFVAAAKDLVTSDATQGIRDLIATAKARLGLDPLLRELEKYATPEQLEQLVDARLVALVERILGESFDRLRATGLGAAADRLHGFLGKLSDFRETWNRRLAAAAHQSLTMDVSYAYSRASSRDGLLDIEVNLATEAGRRLARAAATGNFKAALTAYDPALVRVREGVLTDNLSRSAEIQVNVFGWGAGSAVELVRNLEHSIENAGDGLIHVYTLAAEITQRKTRGGKFKEQMQSRFLLAAVGQAIQAAGEDAPVDDQGEFVIRTLSRLAVEYDMMYRDEQTTPDELRGYLELAASLGLVPESEGAEGMVAELRREFPDGLGEVKAAYVVRYDPAAVTRVFTELSPADRDSVGRRAARGLIGNRFIRLGRTDNRAPVGFAYQSPKFEQLAANKKQALLNETQWVDLPPWFTGGQRRSVQLSSTRRQFVAKLFAVEAALIKRLEKLDGLVRDLASGERAVAADKLAKAAADFVDMADALDDLGRENTFFGVVDALVHAASPTGSGRKTSMVLEITPPGGTKVTKILAA